MSILITANDGAITVPVVRLNVAAGAIDPNGAIDLGSGAQTFLATVTQDTTENPSLTVGLNTLSGTPVFARTSAGLYTLTLTGAWIVDKTFVEWTNGAITTPTTAGVIFEWTRTSDNVLTLKGYDIAGAAADWHQADATLRITVLA